MALGTVRQVDRISRACLYFRTGAVTGGLSLALWNGPVR